MTEAAKHLVSALAVLVDKSDAVTIRQSLTTTKLIDDNFIIKEVNSMIAIPILDDEQVKKLTWFDNTKHEITELNLLLKNHKYTPAQQMVQDMTIYLKQHIDSDLAQLIFNLPQKWELFGNLAIIPNSAMNNSQWQDFFGRITQEQEQEIWQIIARSLRVCLLYTSPSPRDH